MIKNRIASQLELYMHKYLSQKGKISMAHLLPFNFKILNKLSLLQQYLFIIGYQHEFFLLSATATETLRMPMPWRACMHVFYK